MFIGNNLFVCSFMFKLLIRPRLGEVYQTTLQRRLLAHHFNLKRAFAGIQIFNPIFARTKAVVSEHFSYPGRALKFRSSRSHCTIISSIRTEAFM